MNDLITSQKYLDGSLDEIEMIEFEKRLSMDNDLIDDIITIREIDRTFSDEDLMHFENIVKKVIRENRKTKIKYLQSKKYYMVASIILILGILAIVINKKVNNTNDKLYAQYYKKYDPDFIKRSDTAIDDLFSVAIYEYMNGNYLSALEIFNSPDIQKTYSSEFYSGLCLMELEKYPQAIETFEKINDANTIFEIHSKWYTALAYIKTNQNDNATLLLKHIVSEDEFYNEKAKEILIVIDNK